MVSEVHGVQTVLIDDARLVRCQVLVRPECAADGGRDGTVSESVGIAREIVRRENRP